MTATSVDIVLKCSNPSCAKPFEPEHGSFFRFRKAGAPGPTVERFWLCPSCSGAYTLNYVNGMGMQVIDRGAFDPFHFATH